MRKLAFVLAALVAASCQIHWLFWVPAVLVAAFILASNVVPFFDDGHRCYGVLSDHAAYVLSDLLANYGLGEKLTFDYGPTTQTLLADEKTVLLQLHKRARSTGNAISVVVPGRDDLILEAECCKRTLLAAGYTASHEVIDPYKLVVLRTDAFLGGTELVFRRHALKMGKPQQRALVSERQPGRGLAGHHDASLA